LVLRFGVVLELLRFDNWAPPLIAIHVASRAAMPAVMSALPHARDVGLSRSVGQVTGQSALIALAIGALALGAGFGMWGLMMACAAAIWCFLFARLAKAKIGGQTGDVCGASQQVTEVTLLLAILSG